MHRVHHSDEQPETDSNYSSVFSFWDRLFGSFKHRSDPTSIVFGIKEFPTATSSTIKDMLRMPMK